METIHIKRLIFRDEGRELWHYDRIWATDLREFLAYWSARPNAEVYYRAVSRSDREIWTRAGIVR